MSDRYGVSKLVLKKWNVLRIELNFSTVIFRPVGRNIELGESATLRKKQEKISQRHARGKNYSEAQKYENRS